MLFDRASAPEKKAKTEWGDKPIHTVEEIEGATKKEEMWLVGGGRRQKRPRDSVEGKRSGFRGFIKGAKRRAKES